MTHSQQFVIWALNANDASELAFWTESQLWQYTFVAAADFCRKFPALAAILPDVALPPQTSEVVIDAAHVVAVFQRSTDDGLAIARHLDRATMPDLEALGDSWRAEEANFVQSFAQFPGEDAITVWPRLPAGRTAALQVLAGTIPSSLSAGAPSIDLPEAFRPFLVLSTIAAARDHEGDARMPEVASGVRQVTDLLAGALGEIWGE